MKFLTHQISGKGRGSKIGIPTINLKVPQDFKLGKGIYAVWVTIDKRIYQGALHYGPIPTFNQSEDSLEVMLLDVEGQLGKLTSLPVEVEIIKRIRPIIKFNRVDELLKEVRSDVAKAKKLLLSKN